METKKTSSGLSAVEFMMVILLSTVISTIMFTAVNESRVSAKNTAVVSQMLEYQKALNFYFLDNGEYPSMKASPEKIFCFGNGLVRGEGCIGIIADAYDKKVVGPFSEEIGAYMSSLPRIEQDKGDYHYSSPAYSSCISEGDKPDHESNEKCGEQYYSLWFVLEGIGKDCSPADTAIRNLSGEYTLCRLQSK